MKKIILGLVAAVLIVLAFYKFGPAGKSLLGEEIKLYLYTVKNESTGALQVSVPFRESSGDSYLIDIALDLNQDGEIGADEWQVKDASAPLVQNLRNNYWLADEEKSLAAGDDVLAQINFRNESGAGKAAVLEKTVSIEAFELNDIFGFDVPGASEEFKRGGGLPFARVPVAEAKGEEVFRDGITPDLAQGPMECAAVSAANSLMSLAGTRDRLGDLPEFTGELIEELKKDMKYSTRGISLANMVLGKNAFAARHGLPVSTELKTAPTKEDILAALRSGAAVEVSFSFIRSASGRANTGHVVTLVGASESNIFVHDSGTPEGMDSLRMFGTVQTPKETFINVVYPLWDGVAFIDGIVIQNWTEPAHAEESYTDTGEQGSEIEVLVINKQYFPKSFFRVGGHEKCNATHYHAANADNKAYGLKSRTSSEIVSMSDPNPDSCGFGKVSEVPIEKITITFEQSQALIRYMPN